MTSGTQVPRRGRHVGVGLGGLTCAATVEQAGFDVRVDDAWTVPLTAPAPEAA